MEGLRHFELLTGKIHDFLTECPNSCVNKGVNRNLGELPNPSLEALESRAKRAAELRDALNSQLIE